jgi:hypothetical protein
MGLVTLLHAIPEQGSFWPFFAQEQYGWDRKARTTFSLWTQFLGLFSPAFVGPVLGRLGFQGSAIWGLRLGALSILVNSCLPASAAHIVYLTQLTSLVRHGPSAVSRIVAEHSKAAGAGQGELGAATANAVLPIKLIFGPLFNEIYARSVGGYGYYFPGLPNVLRGVIMLVCSEIVFPSILVQ